MKYFLTFILTVITVIAQDSTSVNPSTESTDYKLYLDIGTLILVFLGIVFTYIQIKKQSDQFDLKLKEEIKRFKEERYDKYQLTIIEKKYELCQNGINKITNLKWLPYNSTNDNIEKDYAAISKLQNWLETNMIYLNPLTYDAVSKVIDVAYNLAISLEFFKTDGKNDQLFEEIQNDRSLFNQEIAEAIKQLYNEVNDILLNNEDILKRLQENRENLEKQLTLKNH